MSHVCFKNFKRKQKQFLFVDRRQRNGIALWRICSACTARDSTGLQVLVTQRGDHCLCQAYLKSCLKLQPLALETKGKWPNDTPEAYFLYFLDSCMFCFLGILRLPFVSCLPPWSLGYNLDNFSGYHSLAKYPRSISIRGGLFFIKNAAWIFRFSKKMHRSSFTLLSVQVMGSWHAR